MDLHRSWVFISSVCSAFICHGSFDVRNVAAESLESFKDCADCPEMVHIPAGAFVMGTTLKDLSSAGVPEPFASYQTPAQEVELTSAFAVGKYPVTKAEYFAFVRSTNRKEQATCWSWNIAVDKYEQQNGLTWTDPGFPQTNRDPAVCVSWNDAKAYVDWLSQITGASYRLPSESEREYVTRAGAITAWPWGEELTAICANANVSDKSRVAVHRSTKYSSETVFDCEDGYVYTSPVGMFAPNAFGLYDTLGNVWEWQSDCFQESYVGASHNGVP